MTDPKKAAEDALTPTTFNFAEAVLDRSYPEFRVPVYLNESAVQRLIEVKKELLTLEGRIAKTTNPGLDAAEKLEKLQKIYEDTVDELKNQEYIVTIRGIAPEEFVRLEELTYELYPREFEESVSPVTGQVTRTEIENEDRDLEFATLYRQAHLVSVEDSNGAVDSDWSEKEKVRATFARLPHVSRTKIDEAIKACTIAVDFYRELADEVF